MLEIEILYSYKIFTKIVKILYDIHKIKEISSK